jgi:sulfate transporter 4
MRIQYWQASYEADFPARLMWCLATCCAGWLTNFLSSAMISGFMSGAAITIALSQVPPATRSLAAAEHHYQFHRCDRCLPWPRHPSKSFCAVQVKYITGEKIPRTDTLQDALKEIFGNLDQFR